MASGRRRAVRRWNTSRRWGSSIASVLAVHGVQFEGADLDRLRALGVTLVSCPRSNRHVGVGSPPLEAFYAMDVEVAFGTDSLASVDDLNMFGELAEARRIAPKVPARALLRSATLTGARALGFESEFGSIEPGKRAALIAVRVPDGVSDVEEYLVSGIEPSAISGSCNSNSQLQLPVGDSLITGRADVEVGSWELEVGRSSESCASWRPISRSCASATRCSRCRLR